MLAAPESLLMVRKGTPESEFCRLYFKTIQKCIKTKVGHRVQDFRVDFGLMQRSMKIVSNLKIGQCADILSEQDFIAGVPVCRM